MIENASPELKGFFPSMINSIISKERSAYNKQEAKKSIVALCYMIASLRNKFVNQFKRSKSWKIGQISEKCGR